MFSLPQTHLSKYLDFYFVSSDYEVEFSIPEYCDRVEIFLTNNHPRLNEVHLGCVNNNFVEAEVQSV